MTGNNPLVSVIIPLYNAQKYINETIESVIYQTYTNWELLVVDDCSTDNSRELVREFEKKDSRIRLIESETNFGGPARPRNIGIDNSKGEYVAFLDADDVWLNEKLEIQIKYMIENKIDISSTKESKIDNKGKDLQYSKKEKILSFLSTNHDFNALLRHNFIINSSIVVNSKILSDFRFDEDKMLIAIEDYYLWLEIILNKKCYFYIEDVLVKYRILDGSAVDRNNKIKNQSRRNYALAKLSMKYQDDKLLKSIYKINCLKYIKSLFA